MLAASAAPPRALSPFLGELPRDLLYRTYHAAGGPVAALWRDGQISTGPAESPGLVGRPLPPRLMAALAGILEAELRAEHQSLSTCEDTNRTIARWG